MKLKLLFFLTFLSFGQLGKLTAQSFYTMSSGNYSQDFANIATWTNSYAAGTGANNWRVATNEATSTVNTATVFATGQSGGVQKGTEAMILLATGTLASATDLLLSFAGRNAGTISLDWIKVVNSANNATPRSSDLKIQYSIDNGSTFTDLSGYTIPRVLNNAAAESGSLTGIALPVALNNQSQVVIRFYVWNNGQTGGSGSRPKIQIDNISVTSTAATSPTVITSTSSLTGFSAVTGSNSASQNFTVRATNATERVVVTAPTGFQVSRDNVTFQDTVHTAFVVDSVPTQTIHVRQNSATLGATSGNISCTSAGAATVNVALTGVVLSSQPGTQPNLTVGTVTASTIELTVGNTGGLSNWIIVAKEGSAVDGVPADGTDYTANAIFNSGAIIATNNRVVLKGNGTSVTVTVPNPATIYHFAVYAYNDGGVAASTNYNETTPGTANATTLSVPLGWQINATNTVFSINFDATVDNVNNGSFAAATTFGASNPAAGQLNSNAWAYSANSSGASSFGGALITGFGASTGGVTSSGVFAFEVATGNVALGVQPTGSVFSSGGNLTLRIQNKTGATLNNAQLSYILWVNNNEARSTTFAFSHSTDNSTYTAATDASFSSVLASQGSILWIPQYFSVSLSGLNVAADGFLYLRWSGTDNGGTFNRDEFAIDDISFIAERSSVTLSTAGNFGDVLIDGNVSLSAATTVTGTLNLKSGNLSTGGNLTLRSTSATATANVINGTNASIVGNVTVERFLPWASVNNSGFRFVSHPLASNPVINTVNNLPTAANTLISFNEDLNVYQAVNNRAGTWPQGIGYGAWTDAATTLSFTGALQLSDIPNVQYENQQEYWNLAGNPFPSTLDWDAVTLQNMSNAVYVWVKDDVSVGGGAWGSYINGVATNGGSRYIAPMQGFMVKGTSGIPRITYPAAARTSNNSISFQRLQTSGDVYRVKVTKAANNSAIETVLRFHPVATANNDAAYDAAFISDFVNATPDLYTTDLNGVKYSINAMPAIGATPVLVPLQLETFGAGDFSFTFDASQLVSGVSVQIEDTKLGTFTHLVDGQIVPFSAAANDAVNRFRLHFNGAATSVSESAADLIQMYTHEGALYIRGIEQAESLRILDISGRTVFMQEQLSLDGNALRPNLAKGTYVVQLVSATGVKTVKVIF